MGASNLNICLTLCIIGACLFENAAGRSIVDDTVEVGLSTVLSPVKEVTKQLEDILNEIELKKKEINDHANAVSLKLSTVPKKCLNQELLDHATVLTGWSFDSCVNVTDDCNDAAQIVWTGSQFVINMTQDLAALGNNIVNCPGWNVVHTLECYNANIKGIKDELVAFKDKTQPLVNKGMATLRRLRIDFDHCLGIPVTSKIIVDQHMEKIKDC